MKTTGITSESVPSIHGLESYSCYFGKSIYNINVPAQPTIPKRAAFYFRRGRSVPQQELTWVICCVNTQQKGDFFFSCDFNSHHKFSFSWNHKSKGTDYVKQTPCVFLKMTFLESHSLVATFKHLFSSCQHSYSKISLLKEIYWTEKKKIR